MVLPEQSCKLGRVQGDQFETLWNMAFPVAGCSCARGHFAAGCAGNFIPKCACLRRHKRELSEPTNVLVRGNRIAGVGEAGGAAGARVIEGEGRTLMPGLIDAHTHLMFASIPQVVLLTSDMGFVYLAAGKAATDMLMRGYTSVRDLGGPVFGLKSAIDKGLVMGPRIWPSGAFISQTGGHGDSRLPTELPAAPGALRQRTGRRRCHR